MTMRPLQSTTSASASMLGSTPAMVSPSMSTSPVARSPTCGSTDRTVPPLRRILPMSCSLAAGLRPCSLCPAPLVLLRWSCSLVGDEPPRGGDDLVDGGDDLALESVGEGQRHVGAGHPPHGRVQELETLVG